jgi:hypothetical protein
MIHAAVMEDLRSVRMHLPRLLGERGSTLRKII